MISTGLFPAETLARARAAVVTHRVKQDPAHQSLWFVESLRRVENVYRVQTDVDPETRRIVWITCTCPAGLKAGSALTRCYHALSVLMAIRDNLGGEDA